MSGSDFVSHDVADFDGSDGDYPIGLWKYRNDSPGVKVRFPTAMVESRAKETDGTFYVEPEFCVLRLYLVRMFYLLNFQLHPPFFKPLLSRHAAPKSRPASAGEGGASEQKPNSNRAEWLVGQRRTETASFPKIPSCQIATCYLDGTWNLEVTTMKST